MIRIYITLTSIQTVFSFVSCDQHFHQGQIEVFLAGSGWADINHFHSHDKVTRRQQDYFDTKEWTMCTLYTCSNMQWMVGRLINFVL